MQAVRFEAYGGPEVLRVVEVEEPHAKPGTIRIAVHAAGVNAFDAKLRSGLMSGGRPLEASRGTGVDAAGVVDEVGEGVTDVAIGDAVFGSGSSTYAERAVLAAWARKPDGLSFEEAAGYPVPVETAFRILDDVGVRPGQTLLVSGAAGGVGSATVQLAVDRGIRVIGTASASNQDYLRSLGAIPTTYGDGLVERVRALTAGTGSGGSGSGGSGSISGVVDAALDIAGSGVVPALIELTGEPGRVLSIADFDAPKLGALVSSTPRDPARAYARAAELQATGRFRLPVARTFTLEQAGAAQAASSAGHVAGRYVITLPQ